MPNRIVIVGGPRTGKTTLSSTLGIDNVRHTDDLITQDCDWSESSKIVSGWMRDAGPWVVEGVSTARALRKYIAGRDDKPCDVVLIRFTPWVTLTPGQLTMGRGVRTVFEQIRHELMRRGVEVTS